MTEDEREQYFTDRAAMPAAFDRWFTECYGGGRIPLRSRDPVCWAWPVIDTDDIYEFCDGRCSICGATRGNVHMDHDHETGLNRGMLCHSCNIREGFAGSEESVWTRYRRRNPATILGVEDRYDHPIYGEDIGNAARRATWDLSRSPAYAVARSFAPFG